MLTSFFRLYTSTDAEAEKDAAAVFVSDLISKTSRININKKKWQGNPFALGIRWL